MKTAKLIGNIANVIVFGGATAICLLMAFGSGGDLTGVGILLAVCFAVGGVAVHSLINLTNAQRQQMRVEQARARADAAVARDVGGVHWFWWVFWLVMFFPALLVVAIIHSGRKNRAAIRTAMQPQN